MNDEYLKSTQVAKMLGVSRNWPTQNKDLFEYITLSYSTKKPCIRFKKSSVEKFIESRTHRPENPLARRFQT